MQMTLHTLVTTRVYAHIPRFAGTQPEPASWRQLVVEFLRTVVTSSLALSVLGIGSAREKPARHRGVWSLRNDLRRLNPLALAAKLAIARVAVDLLFWGGQR